MEKKDLPQLLKDGTLAPEQICPVVYAMSLIDRIQYNEIPPHVEYSLSERGKTLIPILMEFHDWGKKQMELAVRTSSE